MTTLEEICEDALMSYLEDWEPDAYTDGTPPPKWEHLPLAFTVRVPEARSTFTVRLAGYTMTVIPDLGEPTEYHG